MVENAEQVLAIELMAAAQGLDYRKPLRPAKLLAEALETVREIVAPLTADRELSRDIMGLAAALRAGAFDRWRTA